MTRTGVVSGLVGGLGRYFLQVQSTPFIYNVMGAVFTAVLCGMAGVAGKELYSYIKKEVTEKIKKRELNKKNKSTNAEVV